MVNFYSNFFRVDVWYQNSGPFIIYYLFFFGSKNIMYLSTYCFLLSNACLCLGFSENHEQRKIKMTDGLLQETSILRSMRALQLNIICKKSELNLDKQRGNQEQAAPRARKKLK